MSNPAYYKRTVEIKQMNSVSLGEKRNLRIFLPPGYNELVSYPAIYCQDGEQFFNFGRIATHATRLILEEGMEPVIIVGVDRKKERRTEEYSPEGSAFEAYCRFFAEELVPWVESNYSVRQVAVARTIAGDSLGATVSLHLALDYPLLFSHVISLSGAFFQSTQSRIKQENELSRLNIYMIAGLDERAVETELGTFDLLDLNRTVYQLLLLKKANVLYREEPGKHTWGFWQKELSDALMHFYSSAYLGMGSPRS